MDALNAVGLAAALLVVLPLAFRDSPYWQSAAANTNAPSVGSLGLWLMFSIGRIDALEAPLLQGRAPAGRPQSQAC